MDLIYYAAIALSIFGVSVIIALAVEIKHWKFRIGSARYIVMFGTFLAVIFLVFPLYGSAEGVEALITTAFVSTVHSAGLFIFTFKINFIKDLVEGFPLYYVILVAAFHVIAPTLSFAFVISLVRHWVALFRYRTSFNRDVHIFSKLNEKTLALGQSLYNKYNMSKKKKGNKRIVIVYTDVIYEKDELHMDLIRKAREMDAILFNKDILSIRFARLRKRIHFYLISDNEQEKVAHADGLIDIYEKNPKAVLYIFSNGVEVKLFLNKCLAENSDRKTGKPTLLMRVIRIDDVKALIYHNLDENGMRLFESANKLPGGTREISAVIVGFGRYGREVLQTLLWYCQLPGYRVRINVLEERKTAESEFRAMHPEILIGKDIDAEGDMRYTLHFREARFGTEEFYTTLESLESPTYVFVCLGTDRQNISAAMGIKTRLVQQKCYPYIETVIYDTYLKECLSVQDEALHAFGDLKGFYSESSVISRELRGEALDVHKRWSSDPDDPAEENDFYMNDYKYYSSLSAALHRRLRMKIKSGEFSDQNYEQMSDDLKREKEEVFPFYYSSELAKHMLPRLNDNVSVDALSKEMLAFTDCLYLRIAYWRYAKLSAEERKKVLVRLQIIVTNKVLAKIRYALSEAYEAELKARLQRKAEAFEDVAAYLRSDAFLEEIKTKTGQDYKDVKKTLLAVEPFTDIPMLADTGEYICGYRECMEAVKPHDGQTKETLSRLRKILDAMIALATEGVNDDDTVREIIHSFEFDRLADADGEAARDVLRYVGEKLGKTPEELSLYFEKARWFAHVEHVRWIAYMRTEGFRRSVETDRKHKLHYDLVPVGLLTVADCVKDI